MAENEVSCTMCGKIILDNRKIMRKISGKDIEFDSHDCADIYERLRDVYGTAIEL